MRTERRLDASMKIGGATVVFAVEGFELTRSLLCHRVSNGPTTKLT